jgi:hypothetical protein
LSWARPCKRINKNKKYISEIFSPNPRRCSSSLAIHVDLLRVLGDARNWRMISARMSGHMSGHGRPMIHARLLCGGVNCQIRTIYPISVTKLSFEPRSTTTQHPPNRIRRKRRDSRQFPWHGFSIVFSILTLHRHQRKDSCPRNPCEHLAVLAPAHVEGALTEDLTLHVDTVLADEAHATLTAGHSALAGALAVVLGVGSVKLVGDASLSHFCNLFDKSVSKGEGMKETKK